MSEPKRPNRPDIYAPRRIHAFGQSYSFFVRVLKFSLPLAALIIIGVLIARLTEEPQQQKISSLPNEEKTTPGQIELVQAKYEGNDEEGHPYTVTADKASRSMTAPDAILFENPLADIVLQDKTWVAVKSRSGSFDRKSENLHLVDDVTVFHDSGYEITLQELDIDLKQKTAATSQPVIAHGPMGSIEAKNMTVQDQGNLIIFGGPATLSLFHLVPRKERG